MNTINKFILADTYNRIKYEDYINMNENDLTNILIQQDIGFFQNYQPTCEGKQRAKSGKKVEETIDDVIKILCPNIVECPHNIATINYPNPINMDLVYETKAGPKVFIECKTYLDGTMFRRTLFDFQHIQDTYVNAICLIVMEELGMSEQLLDYSWNNNIPMFVLCDYTTKRNSKIKRGIKNNNYYNYTYLIRFIQYIKQHIAIQCI